MKYFDERTNIESGQ